MNRKIVSIFRSILFGVIITVMLGAGIAQSKPLFVISDFDSDPMPIRTYEIEPIPFFLSLQSEPTETSYGSGGAYLAIDSTNAKLFATYQGSNIIQVLNAPALSSLVTVSVTGASSLAGIAFDMVNNRVFAVDEGTNHLYVYNWNSATNTLTLIPGPSFNYFELSGVTSAQGIAYDSTRDRLYVADDNTVIPYFSTWDDSDPNPVNHETAVANDGDITLSEKAVGIAVNRPLNIVYAGGGSNHDFLINYDMGTGSETKVNLGKSIIDVAVDEVSGYVYATSWGHGDVECPNSVVILFSYLGFIIDSPLCGDPTGLTIPLDSPLNLSKTGPVTFDNVVDDHIFYEICYDNKDNAFEAKDVVLTDMLPSELAFYDVVSSSPCSESAGVVTCDIGTLAANAPEECITIEAIIVELSCNITNTAEITSSTAAVGRAAVESRGLNGIQITTHALPSAPANQDYSYTFETEGGVGDKYWYIYMRYPSPALNEIFTPAEILEMLDNLTIDQDTGVLTWLSLPQIPEGDQYYINFAIEVWDGCETFDTVAFQYTDPEVGAGGGASAGGGGCFISTSEFGSTSANITEGFTSSGIAFLVMGFAAVPVIYRRFKK